VVICDFDDSSSFYTQNTISTPKSKYRQNGILVKYLIYLECQKVVNE